jgi:hypothetical protein
MEHKMDADLIPQLISAIQNFVLHRTRPEEGIMVEARQFAGQWKLAGRSLFDSSTPDLTLLLAALVAELMRDHELVELIRQHRPDELAELISESRDAEVALMSSGWSSTQRTLTAKQRYERKRSKRNRSFSRSIEFQFGGGLEDRVDWKLMLSPLLGPTGYKKSVRDSQRCLDDIFDGESVNMLRLEELFWMDRHRLARPLRRLRTRRFNYLAVTKIMDFLLTEKRRRKRERSKPGRSPRLPWLYDRAFRLRALSGIEARIMSRSMNSDIASAFLKVIRQHLARSGKKSF